MEPEVDEIVVGVSPEGVPWPDLTGPKPDTIGDTAWQVATMKFAGMTNPEIADHLGVVPSTVQGHIGRLRAKYGQEFLRSDRSRRNRKPSVAQEISLRAATSASVQKWGDIRMLMSSDFGLVSVKALRLAEEILDRYLADTPEGAELRAGLSISDAKTLAALAVTLGDRADKMSAPIEAPGAFTPGGGNGPALFGAIDKTAIDSGRQDERLSQLELIMARFTERTGGTGPPPVEVSESK